MAKEHIVLVSSVWDWGPGDGSILQGVYNLLPELLKYDVHFSTYYTKNHDTSKNDMVKYEELLKTAKYVVVPGTPSWVHTIHRVTWKLCMKYKKPLCFLGIGLAIPYDGDFWYGKEEFMALRDSGLIDLIVCRDRHCHYFLNKGCGISPAKVVTLPCPAFYTFPPRDVTEKKNVVYSLANVDNIATAAADTLKGYYRHSQTIVRELRNKGAKVSIVMNDMIDDRHPFYKYFKEELFPGEELYRFWGYKENGEVDYRNAVDAPGPKAYVDFHKDKHVYIGVRNHGALPCAGAGIPGLLLGTDLRQTLADEIPFLSRLNISRAYWKATYVLDWYDALEPVSISKSLRKWRDSSYNRWREALKPVIERLK